MRHFGVRGMLEAVGEVEFSLNTPTGERPASRLALYVVGIPVLVLLGIGIGFLTWILTLDEHSPLAFRLHLKREWMARRLEAEGTLVGRPRVEVRELLGGPSHRIDSVTYELGERSGPGEGLPNARLFVHFDADRVSFVHVYPKAPPSGQASADPAPFDAEIWHADVNRESMAHALMRAGTLEGMERAAVQALLGDPDDRKDVTFYALALFHGPALVVSFDEHDVVESSDIVGDD